MKKNEKGITLIALVVTIIVLLILAGVSIAMITGDDGILGRAREAGWKSKLGDAEDMIGLEVANSLAAYLTSTTVDKEVGAPENEGAAIVAGCAKAKDDLGDEYTIFTDIDYETSGKDKVTQILIEYAPKSTQKYYVLGTMNGSRVNWGEKTKDTKPEGSDNCDDNCKPGAGGA